LQLEFDISSLSGQAFNTIPVISNDTVSQTVRVKQNETAVLMGLLQRQLSNAINGTPGIAQIPEIGLFAGDQNAQDQNNELLILVTPRMVRFAPRTDHAIYAGQGSLEGQAGNGPTQIEGPQPPPQQPGAAQPAGLGQQPGGVPQPTSQVGTPIAPPPAPAAAPAPATQGPPPDQQGQQPPPQQPPAPPADQSQQQPPQQQPPPDQSPQGPPQQR
jgi:general secretion pathway protein D